MSAATEQTPAPVRKVEARMRGLEVGCLRWRVLAALKMFRASWVDLGRFLNEVVYGGDYKEWGYDDLEVYCARELGLKKPTVQKLMISYNYMRKYEAERLGRLEAGADAGDDGEAAGAPDYQTVELLDRVRRAEGIEEGEMEELHRRAFADGDGGDETALRKELRQRLRPPVAGADHIDAGRAELVRVVRAARALRKAMSATDAVPEGLRERLETALVEVEALGVE